MAGWLVRRRLLPTARLMANDGVARQAGGAVWALNRGAEQCADLLSTFYRAVVTAAGGARRRYRRQSENRGEHVIARAGATGGGSGVGRGVNGMAKGLARGVGAETNRAATLLAMVTRRGIFNARYRQKSVANNDNKKRRAAVADRSGGGTIIVSTDGSEKQHQRRQSERCGRAGVNSGASRIRFSLTLAYQAAISC